MSDRFDRIEILNDQERQALRDAQHNGYLDSPRSFVQVFLETYWNDSLQRRHSAVVLFPPAGGLCQLWIHAWNLEAFDKILKAAEAESVEVQNAKSRTGFICAAATEDAAARVAKLFWDVGVEDGAPDWSALVESADGPLNSLRRFLHWLPISELNWALLQALDAGAVRSRILILGGKRVKAFTAEYASAAMRMCADTLESEIDACCLELFLDGKICAYVCPKGPDIAFAALLPGNFAAD